MVGKVEAIQSVKTPHTVNYPIKIRQTLVEAKFEKTKGPKQQGIYWEPNPTLKYGH